MAVKRKTDSSAATVAQKKSRTVSAAASPDLDWASDDSADLKVNFTDSGARRADSEARRQWHFICEVEGCGQRFNRPCRLESHMRSHNKERPFACTEPACDKTFPRKDHLQRHMRNAHNGSSEQGAHICDWEGCGKTFTSAGRLQRHKDVHESKLYCKDYPPCHESFRKQTALDAHIKSQHLEVKPFPCTFVNAETSERCTKGYQTENALQKHMSNAHGKQEEGTLYCMLCMTPATETETMEIDSTTTTIPKNPLVFTTAEELRLHSLEYHPPVCPECGQRFKNEANLKSHVETVHSGTAARFPCTAPSCDAVFTRKHNLTVHIQSVHEHQFKYHCVSTAVMNSKHADLAGWNGENACGHSFKAKSSLDNHIRTHHLGQGNRKERRLAAKSRKKEDPSMAALLTGVGYDQEREIPCIKPECEFRFHRDIDLRRHLKAVHNMTDDEASAAILERDAAAGGQFWIGGLNPGEEMGLFGSATPSMPQTPMPYFTEGATEGMDGKTLDGYFGHRFDQLSLFNEEAEMDAMMGIGDLPPAVDVGEGLQWDMLAPVEQYNNLG
ncbi:Strongly-conserved Zn-finger binding protein (TFIIIA) [Curvularia kusanoi]|uniref:Strongly-conserved Zn-finger binding protein (TFIIIA) n=1 Tax=Curvularia kusanoi TaxID=90978 RepID=A0A9P4W882_CURKU|nr:Strongly-conserved Zn-finger binding protein (TFIIIA) [Curvularia kusanoi]